MEERREGGVRAPEKVDKEKAGNRIPTNVTSTVPSNAQTAHNFSTPPRRSELKIVGF